VPTESRPGHVALLAGLYEDPSAITAGWSHNPVMFDSVLNRSTHAWAWGSPDILPMFAKGSARERVTTDSYQEDMEDFASENLSELDTWVFDRVERFFKSASDNHTLQLLLRESGNVFFLHLLGCDTNGHVHKPHSKQYKDNIKSVDQGVDRIIKVFDKYFRGDGRTAYLFTSDHGMTDWGSHGTGMDQETVTPLVAWGAGIKKLEKNIGARGQFDQVQAFQNINRIEVNQADMAPLMSTLIGKNIPVNSVGRLPVEMVDMHPTHQVEAMMVQIDQLLAQFKALERRHQQVYFPSIFHIAYDQLEDEKIFRKKQIIKNTSKQGHNKETLRLCSSFLDEIMDGIEYYQRYQKIILITLIRIAFVGCALVNLAKLTSNGRKSIVVKKKYSNLIFTLAGLSLASANFCWFCQGLPPRFLLYYNAPVFVWFKLVFYVVTRSFVQVQFKKVNMLLYVQIVAVILIIKESFFDRRWLSFGFLTLLIHPIVNSQVMPRNHFPFWFLSLVVLAVFPWLPVVDGRNEHLLLVLLSGFVTSFSGLFWHLSIRLNFLKLILCSCPIMAGICVYYTGSTVGLSSVVQSLAWLIFMLSMPASLVTKPFYLERTPFLCFSLISSYLLLSLSYEAIFLPILCLAMALWSKIEDTQSQDVIKKNDHFGAFLRENRGISYPKRMVTLQDVSCILSFMFVIFYSFFATGNIASLNSFDPSSIKCFVAVFSPFLMGGLLLIKILIPFLCVSLFFIQIIWFRGCDFGLVMNVLQLFCDILGLLFFNLVQSTGSWLDIGTSLSHFVIVEGTTIFIVILLYFAAMISKFKVC
jgi:phosphatidylinositol glycan class N